MKIHAGLGKNNKAFYMPWRSRNHSGSNRVAKACSKFIYFPDCCNKLAQSEWGIPVK